MQGARNPGRQAEFVPGRRGAVAILLLALCLGQDANARAAFAQERAFAASGIRPDHKPADRLLERNLSLDLEESKGFASARLRRIVGLQQMRDPEKGDWRRQADFGLELPEGSPLNLGLTGELFETRSPLVLSKPSLEIGPVRDWEENRVTDLHMDLGLLGERVGYSMGFARSETELFGLREEEDDEDPLNLREDDDDDDLRDVEGVGEAQWHRLDLSLIEGDSLGATAYAFYGDVDDNFYSLQDQVDRDYLKKGETWKLGGALEVGPAEFSAAMDRHSLVRGLDRKDERRREGKIALDWVALSFFSRERLETDIDEDDGDRETENLREFGGKLDFGVVAVELSERQVATDFLYPEFPGLWRIDERSLGTGLSFDFDDYRWSEDGDFTLWGLLPSSLSLFRRHGDAKLSWAPDSPPDKETLYALDLYWDWWGLAGTAISYETMVYDSNEIGLETADERDHILDLSQSFYGPDWDLRLSLDYSDYEYELLGQRSFDSSLGAGLSFKWRPSALPDLGFGADLDAMTSRSLDLGYDSRELQWSLHASLDFTKYMAELFPAEREPYLRLGYYYETQDSRDRTRRISQRDRGHAALLQFGLDF